MEEESYACTQGIVTLRHGENTMPDDAWHILFRAEPPGPPEMQRLIAETERLLARMHTLCGRQLRTLATNLAKIADYIEAMAEREERGDSGSPTR
jgi:hypothetical protein